MIEKKITKLRQILYVHKDCNFDNIKKIERDRPKCLLLSYQLNGRDVLSVFFHLWTIEVQVCVRGVGRDMIEWGIGVTIFLWVWLCTESSFVFKARGIIGHLKTRLVPHLKPSKNLPNYSLFKQTPDFISSGQNVLYNAQVLRL